MDKKILKSKMRLYGDNNKTLASKLNITPSAMSRKINGKSDFNIEEMKFVKKEYMLNNEEFIKIFFD